MKGKLVTMAVSFLLCVGMVGAGFASWIITNTAKDEAEGTIAVDTVVDKRLQLKIDKTNTNLGVYFGAPTGDTNTTDTWLRNDSDKKEMLTAKVVVDLNGENLKKLASSNESKTATVKLTAKLEIPTGNTAYNTAVEYGLITAPTTVEVEQTVTATEASTDQEVTFTFEFGWGSYFTISEGDQKKMVNPYKYFNDSYATSDDTNMVGGTEMLFPVDKNEQPIDTTDVTLGNAGDLAAFVLGLIEDIETLNITVTITGTVA